MGNRVGFFNISLSKILTADQSLLDQARIRLLYYGFWLVFVAVFGLFITLYFQHQVLLASSAGIVLVCIVFLFKYLTYKPNWRQISHALIIMATLTNLNNVFIAMQKVDVIAVQVIIIIVLFSFYMFGQTWGLIYSLISIVPVMIFYLLQYSCNYSAPLFRENVDESTIMIGVFANFIIIIYIHSYFYNAFVRNIRQLNETSREQLELNAKLNVAIERAEKSSQIKSEFLATMSHEIRTPLNAIIGMSNVMIMANPRPDQKENLNVLKFSANNLLSIVNDVLDFSKIESGKVVFEQLKFNVNDLLQNICGSQIVKAKEKGVAFKIKIDADLKNKVLFGDPTRLSQILFNLVTNAVKFTTTGNIWVKAFCNESKPDKVVVTFTVKDTGIGIDKGNLHSIFEPFTQESITSTRQYGGTGLGLAIVKRLLDLQGLQMQVSSKLEVGSEFSFTMEFPIANETYKVGERHPMMQNNDVLSNLKVLIAEDNPVNVLLMKKFLSRWQIIPVIAENGQLAIESLQENEFDIILMDLQMPVLDGFDAAIKIRRLTDLKKAGIPIIALSAAAMVDIREQILNAGMNDYVSKPFKPEELVEKIQHLVSTVY